MKPTIFGMAVKADYAMPDDYDFLVQYEPPQPQTNADRLRAMTDEELADFVNDAEYGFLDRPGMCDVCDQHRVKDCLACWLSWLKSPVEEEQT